MKKILSIALAIVLLAGCFSCKPKQISGDASATQADQLQPSPAATPDETENVQTQPIDENIATRQYAINAFAYTLGRNTLRANEPASLAAYTDGTEIAAEYRYNIALAISYGLTDDIDEDGGEENTNLRPNDAVTRLEALLLLANSIPNLPETTTDSGFSDVPAFAKTRIDSLVKEGYLTVDQDKLLQPDETLTKDELDALASILDGIITNVRLEDDFYTYINRYAMRNQFSNSDAEIAAGAKKVTWSYFADAQKRIYQTEDDMLNAIVYGTQTYADGSVEKKIRDFYELCAESDKVGNTPLQPFFKLIDDCENMDDLSHALVTLAHDYGMLLLFDLDQYADEKEPNKLYFNLDAPYWSILSFMEIDGTLDTYQARYKAAYEKLMRTCGVSQTELDSTHDDELALELQLNAGLSHAPFYMMRVLKKVILNPTMEGAEEAGAAIRGDVKDANSYQPKNMTGAEMEQVMPNYDMFAFLAEMGGTGIDKVHVVEPKYLENINSLYTEENPVSWKLYLKKAVVGQCLAYLSNDIEMAAADLNIITLEAVSEHTYEEWMAYLTELLGSEDAARAELDESDAIRTTPTELTPQNCMDMVKLMLADDIAKLYIDTHYSADVKDTIVRMIEDIRSEFKAHIAALEWMSDATKENAIKKLDNIVMNVLYPEYGFTPDILPAAEGGSMLLYRTQHWAMILAYQSTVIADPIKARQKWMMDSDTVNACYIPSTNSINIPAGILTFPFYDETASYYENLGAIGAIIGHEITHGFDTSGSEYDEYGRKINWWTSRDQSQFKKLAQKVVDYYNLWEYLPGQIQDASRTVGEDIADLGGLSCVYSIMEKGGATDDELRSAMERYAMMWARLANDNTYVCGANDVHSEHNVRVNAGLSSLDVFYRLYNIQEGDKMYIAPEDRAGIW